MTTIVEAPGTIAGDRLVTALHDPDRGRVALAVPPACRDVASVASEILRCLGKARSVAPVVTAGSAETELAAIWLRAHRTGDLYLLNAGSLARSAMPGLGALADAAGVRLWVLVDRPGDRRLQPRTDGDHIAQVPWTDFVRDVIVPLTGIGRASAPTTGTAPVRRAHPRPASWGENSAAFLVAFAAAAGWPRDERPSRRALAALLVPLLARFDDPRCLASAVDGAGVALLDAGWSVTLDPDAFGRARALAADWSAGRTGPALLRIFRSPLQAAAAVLMLLPDLSDREALALAIDDVAEDGGSVRVAGEWIPVPDDGAVMLRALRIERLRSGSEPTAPYLAGPRFRRDPAALRSLVRATLAEVGIRIAVPALRSRPTEEECWLEERGVRVTWLAREERPRRRVGGYEPREIGEAIRLAAQLVEREGPVPEHCACPTPHPAPRARDLPAWPPARGHAPLPYDVGLRRNAIFRRVR